MTKLLAILLSALIVFSSTRDLATYAYFYVNQDFIIENFCINIDKPDVMCYGSCYLQDSLLENDQDKQDKPVFPQLEERPVYVVPAIVEISNNRLDLNNQRVGIAFDASFYHFERQKTIFHPPKEIA